MILTIKKAAKGIWRFVSYLFWPQLHYLAHWKGQETGYCSKWIGDARTWGLLTHLTDYTAYLPTALLYREFAHNASNICIKHKTFAQARRKQYFCGHKQAHMAFEWKNSKDIFKGSWIYHLTFAVAGRRPLLGSCTHVALPRILHYWLLSHSYIGAFNASSI